MNDNKDKEQLKEQSKVEKKDLKVEEKPAPSPAVGHVAIPSEKAGAAGQAK